MIDVSAWSLLLAAATIGVIHTALGPDHYVPFVMLARARGWSPPRTAVITALCGVGHVGSSVVLGGVGALAGLSLSRIGAIEGGRGNVAAWLLLGFGIAYTLWGARRALRGARGLEAHTHGGHVHIHGHGDRPHDHGNPGESTTFWSLFLVFVLGPCEPLIPLFLVPAGSGRWSLAAAIALVFGAITIVTMVGLVLLPLQVFRRLDFGPLERWSHAAAGVVIACSGGAVLWFGL